MPDFEPVLLRRILKKADVSLDAYRSDGGYRALTKALNDTELRRIFADNSYEPMPDTPADVTARTKAELSKWTTVVKDTGMKPE